MYYSFRQRKAIEKKWREKWLGIFPPLNDDSGIYILCRKDEHDIQYAYIGQAKHVLTRLVQHSLGYDQHIDKSLKKHGLWSDKNPFGWYVKDVVACEEVALDDRETEYISLYASLGYQLRNKTGGSQSKGKYAIDENKSPKGYYDGKKQGYEDCQRFIKTLFEKYLDFSGKKENAIIRRKVDEFKRFLEGEHND